MVFSLENVVPWGREFAEYQRMFSLTETDLEGRILGCGDGPASFNAEGTKIGHNIVSVDPLYEFSTEQIQQRIDDIYEMMVEKTRENRDEFVWEMFDSPDALAMVRMQAMRRFLEDYDAGKAEYRYQAMSLPELSFPAESFDLALCSHFLFLYSEQFSLDFHISSVKELMRVAEEARFFPLTQLGSTPSPHVNPVIAAMKDAGFNAEVQEVDYELQRGGNKMLRVWRIDR